MPTNWHEKEVIYESFEGRKTIYVTNVRWKDNHIEVNHYPEHNEQEFVTEDTVGMYSEVKQIPLDRVYEVNSISA